MRLAHSLFLLALLSVSIAGCGSEKSEAEKDKLTPQALKAMENPPPGAPGPPPGAAKKTPPGQPAPGTSPISNPDAGGSAAGGTAPGLPGAPGSPGGPPK